MRTILTIIAFGLSTLIYGQTLLPESAKIKSAFDKLSADTGNVKLRSSYILAFPSDKKTFIKVFDPEKFDQLYSSSYDYVTYFEMCASTYPKEVIDKSINIAKDLAWDADAIAHLQMLCVKLSKKYISLFLDKYKELSVKEQDSLITFYADVENHSAYKEYQDLIDALNSVGQKDISKKLEVARANRKKQKDH